VTGGRLVPVARIVRPHGLRGEVRVLSLTEGPVALAAGTACQLVGARGEPRPCRVERWRPAGDAAIVLLAGIDSREAALGVVGHALAVAGSALAPLPAGTFYTAALLGARVVTEDGAEVGRFAGLAAAPGQDLWVVRQGDREHLIPAVAEIVREVDVAAGRVTIRPPAGLLELA
jgi:16S rRNA processing protein RimM